MGKDRWSVTLTKKSAKQFKYLKNEKPKIAIRAAALFKEIEISGPLRYNWPHFGKLNNSSTESYHCHIKEGRPTYVICWKIDQLLFKTIEVYYVGTHENAPY